MKKLKNKFIPGCIYLDHTYYNSDQQEFLLLYEGKEIDCFRFVIIAASSVTAIIKYKTRVSTDRKSFLKVTLPYSIKDDRLKHIPQEDLPLYMYLRVKRPLFKELLGRIDLKTNL